MRDDLRRALNDLPSVADKLTPRYEVGIFVDEKEGVIAIETLSHFNNQTTRIAYEMFNTKEAMVKDALVKLGWTPPCHQSKLSIAISLINGGHISEGFKILQEMENEKV